MTTSTMTTTNIAAPVAKSPMIRTLIYNFDGTIIASKTPIYEGRPGLAHRPTLL